MDKSIIKEINSFEMIFLDTLHEDEDGLTIDICGSYLAPPCYDTDGTSESIRKILSEAAAVIPDESTVYRITFEKYVSYNVSCESYTSWDSSEEFYGGLCFRIYTKSKYMDYINSNTFAEQVLGKLTHFGICCSDHIIDIISDTDPRIIKMSF